MLRRVFRRKLVSNWVTALRSSLEGLDYTYPEIFIFILAMFVNLRQI